MQSPETFTQADIEAPRPPVDPRTRALGYATVAALLLLVPTLAALFFYLVSVAAHSYHAMIAAFYGVY